MFANVPVCSRQKAFSSEEIRDAKNNLFRG
jgi:hypothetical protein